jgi:hypothetical protein
MQMVVQLASHSHVVLLYQLCPSVPTLALTCIKVYVSDTNSCHCFDIAETPKSLRRLVATSRPRNRSLQPTGKAPSACEGFDTTSHTHLGQLVPKLSIQIMMSPTCTTEVHASFDLVSSNRSSSILFEAKYMHRTSLAHHQMEDRVGLELLCSQLHHIVKPGDEPDVLFNSISVALVLSREMSPVSQVVVVALTDNHTDSMFESWWLMLDWFQGISTAGIRPSTRIKPSRRCRTLADPPLFIWTRNFLTNKHLTIQNDSAKEFVTRK